MSTLFDFVGDMIDDGIEKGFFPSGSVGIGVGEEVLYTYAAGRLSLPGSRNTDENTRYDMASLTKILSTTMVAFYAIEHGDLTLYDTLSRYFHVPEDKREITVFQLMTHTAGIEPSFHLSDETDQAEAAVQVILSHPLICKPGERVNYSCMGYILLGKALEKIYRKPLNLLAQELVFAPLGMTNTGYLPEGGNIAATEVSGETGIAWQGTVHDENARFLGGVSANAGVFSNIRDMLRFGGMLASGGMIDGKRYLSKAMLDKTTVNYTPGQEQHRGLGFHLSGGEYTFFGDLFPDNAFGHTGFTGTSLAIDPNTGLHVSLLTNRVHPTRENLGLMRFRRTLHNAIYATYSRNQR